MAADHLLLDDLLVEVLLRVPVESLCRCRCVCRRWNAAIADHLFLKSHRLFQKPRPFIFSSSSNLSRDWYSLSSMNNDMQVIRKIDFPSDLRALPTFLDLVCLRDCSGIYIRLYSPNNGQMIDLPPWSPASSLRGDMAIGFGYVESTKEFKVVRVCGDRGCEIFTVGDRIWRRSEIAPFKLLPTSPAIVGTVLYFLPRPNLPVIRTDKIKIACYDLETEKWSKISLPACALELSSRWELRVSIMELGGVLAVAVRKVDAIVELWMLKDKDEGLWTEEFVIILPLQIRSSILQLRTYLSRTMMPLAIEHDGRMLMHSEITRKLYRYDHHGRTWEVVADEVNAACLYVVTFPDYRRNLSAAAGTLVQ